MHHICLSAPIIRFHVSYLYQVTKYQSRAAGPPTKEPDKAHGVEVIEIGHL